MEFLETRYDRMPYRRCGRSGLLLPAIALGCGRNFGDTGDQDEIRRMLCRAFDLGITYIDVANTYGPPNGSAERNVGRVLSDDLAGHRDELVIATKVGSPMWRGPYGDWGSRKHILSSIDRSLQRLGLDYVDLYYHHRPDPRTPLEETLGALHQIVQQGKALYAGISNYSGAATCESACILRSLGTQLTVHQPDYSLLLRGIETELLPHTERLGVGVVAYSPLARGMLSDRYLARVQVGDRVVGADGSLRAKLVTPGMLSALQALSALARERGQTLAQLALAWVVRHPRVTTALIGASRADHLDENLAAFDAGPLTDEELQRVETILASYDEIDS